MRYASPSGPWAHGRPSGTLGALRGRLCHERGGRIAEELVFGDISTGAQDDLQRATDLGRHMIACYGMSETLGLATFDGARHTLFLQVPGGG